jgi:hypothetical protein
VGQVRIIWKIIKVIGGLAVFLLPFAAMILAATYVAFNLDNRRKK